MKWLTLLILVSFSATLAADEVYMTSSDPAAYVTISKEEYRRAQFRRTHRHAETDWHAINPDLSFRVEYPYAYLKTRPVGTERCNITHGDCAIACDNWYDNCQRVHFTLKENYLKAIRIDSHGNEFEYIQAWQPNSVTMN